MITYRRLANAAYWKSRARREVGMAEKTAEKAAADMRRLYERAADGIQKEIDAFYGRYARNNGLTLAEVHRRLNPAELKGAKRALKEYYDFADPAKIRGKMAREYRTKLRLLSARSYMSRLETLRASLRDQCFRLAAAEDSALENALSGLYADVRRGAAFDLDRRLGFCVGTATPGTAEIERIISREWLGDNFSGRVWKDKAALLSSLETDFTGGVARGWGAEKIARAMRDTIGSEGRGDFYRFMRLARTECAHAATQAKFDELESHGLKKYQFNANHGVQKSGRACAECIGLDGMHFDLKYAETGMNYPPMHPNCFCYVTAYFEPDDVDRIYAEAEKSGIEPVEIDDGMTYDEWVRANDDALARRKG